MNKVLVLSKGTSQSKSFERVIVEHTRKENLPIKWIFTNDSNIKDYLNDEDISVTLISPEMMLVEEKLKAELDSKNLPYIVLKPVDFGLKRVEKILPLLDPYFN
ncbi:hypothetical protein K5V21_14145 [Clostridium sardiniense]|uniref:PTS EIIB type-3 domain-containing protein n=1 Tax=Clostridium sardiniense TaxID=29369 RepID=A0ABS7L0L2_CLOSR|nr:hypothetical protein [Clostridium sardiniense]MBY0756586.1 hypothetical protein [Clostridium sardiniense]MDQ0460335.1 PTS system cellobiose-specific IIB component [Clostridium sardiniense]